MRSSLHHGSSVSRDSDVVACHTQSEKHAHAYDGGDDRILPIARIAGPAKFSGIERSKTTGTQNYLFIDATGTIMNPASPATPPTTEISEQCRRRMSISRRHATLATAISIENATKITPIGQRMTCTDSRDARRLAKVGAVRSIPTLTGAWNSRGTLARISRQSRAGFAHPIRPRKHLGRHLVRMGRALVSSASVERHGRGGLQLVAGDGHVTG